MLNFFCFKFAFVYRLILMAFIIYIFVFYNENLGLILKISYTSLIT